MIAFLDNKHLEFTISLFTRCNLHCGFCAQDHKKDLNTHELLGIPDKVFTTFLVEKNRRAAIDTVNVRIWGGELFSDDIPDEYFKWYDVLRTRIKERFEPYPDVKLTFCYTTNATFSKVDRVVDFLEDGDKLAISYDPTLRYDGRSALEQTVRDNITKLHERFLIAVGIVLTKPTIEYYMNNFEEFTSFINAPYIDSVVFNYYIPNKGWATHMPTDFELGAFLVRCLDEGITKVENLNMLRSSFEHGICVGKECECKFLPNIFNGEVTKNCVACFSNLPQEDFYGESISELKDISSTQKDNISEIKALKGMVKCGCDICEYAEICPGMCWTSVIFKYNEISRCPLKMCYDYLKSN